MKIRKATMKDKNQILGLVGGLYSRSSPMMLKEWRKHYNKLVKTTLVTELNEEIIAYISFIYRKNSLFICDLYVLPKYRGRKIAYNLLKEIEKIKRRKKLKNLLVSVRKKDVPAKKLYKKFGFKFLELKSKNSIKLIK